MNPKQNPNPPENLPTEGLPQDEPEPAQTDQASSQPTQSEPSASGEGKPKLDEVASVKPSKTRKSALDAGLPAGALNRTVWLGVILFVLGVVLGGGVGWALLRPVPSAPGTPVAPEHPTTPPAEPKDQEPGGQAPPAPQLTPAQQRDQQRLQDLADLRLALELYRQDKGQFPVSPEVSKSIDGTDYALYQLVEEGIIAAVPQDPLASTQHYYYGYLSQDGSDYRLTAVAESPDTPCRQIREDLCIIEYGPEGLLNQQPTAGAELPETSH